ncbi:unnamed protein product [Orchesella dallaii]|uniref:Cytochrome P450 n=1 Tax=Orchesella dallaii TaxID=48710 RepID=A0ABP1PPA9_9HEXA
MGRQVVEVPEDSIITDLFLKWIYCHDDELLKSQNFEVLIRILNLTCQFQILKLMGTISKLLMEEMDRDGFLWKDEDMWRLYCVSRTVNEIQIVVRLREKIRGRVQRLKPQRKKQGNRKTTKFEPDGNAACTAYMDQVFFNILIDIIEKDDGESVVATVKILDVIDCYLEQLQNATDPESTFFGANGEKKALATVVEVFQAGPRSLPLLGNMLDMKRNGHLKLSEWAEQYGPLFTVKIGIKSALVVSDAKLMKELFGHSAATGKFKTVTILELSKGSYGVVNTEGEIWHEQRQFLVRTLINFGFGKPTMEPWILADVHEAIDWMKKDMDEHGTVEVFKMYKVGVINALGCIVSGERQSKEDQSFCHLVDAMLEAVQYSVKSGLFFLYWLKNIIPEASGYNYLVKTTDDLHDYVEKLFDTHSETFIPGSPRLEHLKIREIICLRQTFIVCVRVFSKR